MVVCNFFLQGRCKFGENCRNEHYYPGSNYNNSNQYNYRNQGYGRSQPQTNSFQGNFTSQQNRFSVLTSNSQNIPKQGQHNQNFDYRTMIQEDALGWERSGQWPFSCYAPLLRRVLGDTNNVNSSTLPGLIDYSPEELRWEAYCSSSLEQYIEKVRQLAQEYSSKRQALQRLDSSTLDFIIRYERGENVSPSGTPLGQVNILASPPQPPLQAASSGFKFQLPSIFPQTNQPSTTVVPPSAFGQHTFGNNVASNPLFASSNSSNSSFKFMLPSQPPNQTNPMMNNAATQPVKSTFSFTLPNMPLSDVQHNSNTISHVANPPGLAWGAQQQQLGFSAPFV